MLEPLFVRQEAKAVWLESLFWEEPFNNAYTVAEKMPSLYCAAVQVSPFRYSHKKL